MIIKPLKKYCNCGCLVKNNHLLCDSCWGNMARIRERIRRTKINMANAKTDKGRLILKDNIKKLNMKLNNIK